MPPWGELPRATDDNQKIDEAIDAAITAHNEDSEAHLGDDEALEVHRQNTVIDHPAESVVNDKLQLRARSYIAIVDPSDEEAFDTIESAVAYAITKGGGTILLAPGTYYLSGATDVPTNINFASYDTEAVIVHGDYDSGDFLNLVDDAVSGQLQQTFENITFYTDGAAVVASNATDLTNVITALFINCKFDGGAENLFFENAVTWFQTCNFYCGADGAVNTDKMVRADLCNVYRFGSETTCIFISNQPGGVGDNHLILHECVLDCGSATHQKYFDDTNDVFLYLYNCRIDEWDWDLATIYVRDMISCWVTGKSGEDFTFQDDGGDGTIAFNYVIPTGGGTISCNAYAVIFLGNVITGAAANFPQDVNYREDALVDCYEPLSSGTTALGLQLQRAVEITPNSTRTFTTDIARAGEMRQVIIKTSGTTPYTLTFGTGFRSAGTLSTGSSTGKVFVLNFVSDGVKMIEVSRTGAIT